MLPDLAYRRGEDRGPTVVQLVAVDARYDGVLEAHLSGGVGHAPRLVEVELGRLTGQDGAETARAGADVAQDHEGRGAVVPALPYVRAPRLLADGVQTQAAHGLFDVRVALTHRRLCLEPLGPPVQSPLLPEGQVLRRRAVRGRGDGPVFPAVTDLERLRTVVEDLDVDLSARHGSPISLAICALWYRTEGLPCRVSYRRGVAIGTTPADG
ncbi:MAG: hypothetical protein K0S10_3285 [Rubrobacteraceae bacterium]|nr:hypothetical protein [Rubrobacteraceae bacterium]